MPTKTCKQCGEIKPQEQFRQYYGGRKGTYKTCKFCEKINSREKYLAGKDGLDEAEETELSKIHQLWEAQVKLGLQPPRSSTGKATPITEDLDDMLSRYEAAGKNVQMVNVRAMPQPGLIKWRTEELTKEPEYYQEVVYEDLKAKYRPVLRIDKDTMLPVYDDTYKSELAEIAARFDEYEDQYYSQE